jgi:hypothetical protein
MPRLKTLFLCGVLSLSSGSALAGPPCFSAEEASAVQVRQLHLRLQVAALKCSDPAWGLRDRYNGYVSKFGGSLSSNARSLRAALKRTGEARTETQFDRFITRIANDISLASENSSDYCQQHRAMLDEVLAAPRDALPGFASAHEPVPAGACSLSRRADAGTPEKRM